MNPNASDSEMEAAQEKFIKLQKAQETLMTDF
jgi:hypothetical protein